MTSTIDLITAKLQGIAPVHPTKVAKPVADPARFDVTMTQPQLARKEWLRDQLKAGVWIVEFNKVDGTPSIMEATLDPALLLPIDPLAPPARPEQAHLLHVYAVDRQGWRSFAVNNLIRIYKAGAPL
jgi:hypothetical protein